MKLLAEPGDGEFESLPPALRKKYFSNNAERVGLQLALTHHNHRHGSLSPSPARVHSGSNGSGSGLRIRSRPCPSPNALNRDSRSHRLAKSLSRSCNSRKLCKPRSLQLAYLAAQADSQCFYSLPAKIQQKHFSEEERRRFRIAYHRFVLDAADRHHIPNLSPRSLRSRPSQSTVPFSQASTLYLDSSDPRNMDDSLYDSFRWLDEDAELDLSLDGYHAHNVNTMPKLPPRRRPSFRRTMSFNSVNLGRKPSAAVRHRGFPSLSRTSNPMITSNTNTLTRVSTSRPPSRNDIPRSSTSSIEPSAQYYQDPEARLKLRVYLSSPQKFDEAIQFGFPALENKESHSPEPPAETKPDPPEFTGTFLDVGDGDGDDKSVSGEKDDLEPELASNLNPNPPTDSRLSTDIKESPSKPGVYGGQWLPPSSSPQDQSGNREMTLKMTLTRPDLRDSATPSPVENKLRDADLYAGDGSRSPELELEGQGPVKKIWRKFWRGGRA